MSAGLKDLMDDVAADAVTGRLIDPGAVRELASGRRNRLRTLGSAMMLAAAAAVLALLVLPLFSALAVVAPASGGATGLPDRWYFAPASAPTIRTWPMQAASMLLHGPDESQWTLVAADGSRYARLPDRLVKAAALSDDGRKVAWVSGKDGGLVLHETTLADGRRRSQAVAADGSTLTGLAFDGDEIHLAFQRGSAWTERRATFGDDRPLETSGYGVAYRRAQGDVTSGDRTASVTGPLDGRLAVRVDAASGGSRTEQTLPLPQEVTSAQLLAWAPGGIVLRLDFTAEYGIKDMSVALLDPDTGELHAVSRPSTVIAGKPVAAAVGVVGDGSPVHAVEPTYPRWNRDRIAYGLDSLWANDRTAVLAGGVLLVVLLGGGGWWLRRRHPRKLAKEPVQRAFRGATAAAPVRSLATAGVGRRTAFTLAAALLVAAAVPAVC